MQLLIRIFILFQFVVFSTISFSAICQNANPKVEEAPIAKKNNSKKKSDLESKIVYKANDSIRFEVKDHKVYLYGNAEVTYNDINLKAAFIELDFTKDLVHATYLLDSTNKEIGVPIFTQGAETFKAKDLIYNFQTKRGLIKKIYSKEGDGFIQGNTVKKEVDNVIMIKNGAYTTCNLEHPHFELKFGKAKVIPNDKIITGPAYLTVEDLPTPLAVPFGFFPNVKGQKDGILIPSYGNTQTRGYFLTNGGYYWGFNDKADLQLRSDIYSRGSWGLKALTSYIERYKYSGKLELDFSNNISGEKGTPDYLVSKDFKIRWSHTQDPKSNPNSQFSASINAGTGSYNKYNSYNPNDYLSNQMQSSVSYRTSFLEIFNLQLNANHSQNTATKSVNITPSFLLNANKSFKILPNKTNSPRLTISYASEGRAVLDTYDSLFFRPQTINSLQKGIRHTVNANTNLKLSFITITPAVSLKELWYFDHFEESYINKKLTKDTIVGFMAGHDINASVTASTKIYGMVTFKKSRIKAIRHIITPTIRWSANPNQLGNYRRMYIDTTGGPRYYSTFDGAMFGYPSLSKSNAVTFAIANNLEMKVRSKKDTINGFKKINLIDNFTVDYTYDFSKTTFKSSTINTSLNTKLFKNTSVVFRSTWDPYISNKYDITGASDFNRYEYNVDGKLLRLKSTNWNFSLTWNMNSKKIHKSPININNVKGPEGEIKEIKNNPNSYVDFNIPWNLNLSLTLMRDDYYNMYYPNTNQLTETINTNGDINLTKKWKIGFNTGYDFIHKGFSYTSIDIFRDLHCWEMKFNWIPFGFRKSYLLTIRVKSSVLQDLKLQKKPKNDWGNF